MDDRFLTPSRLDILRQVTQGITSASAVAKSTGISLPYVLTQLQLLEAKNFIKIKKNLKQTGPGKPKTNYELATPFAHLLLAKEGFCEKVTFSQAPPSMLLYLQLTSFVMQQLSHFSKYFWKNSPHFAKLTAFAKIEIKPGKMEFLAICEDKDLEKLRKAISNNKITENKEEVLFVTWIHTKEEMEEGIAKNDFYYKNLVERMNIILDEKEVLKQLQVTTP